MGKFTSNVDHWAKELRNICVPALKVPELATEDFLLVFTPKDKCVSCDLSHVFMGFSRTCSLISLRNFVHTRDQDWIMPRLSHYTRPSIVGTKPSLEEI